MGSVVMSIGVTMKVLVKDMREPKVINIQGTEPWLNEIYASFLGSEGFGLKGQVTVTPEDYGLYTVEGKIEYVPLVGCSRCDREIPWPINRAISVRFIDRVAAESSFEIEGEVGDEMIERDLVSEDLDTYYLEPSGELDVEMVINDIVQTALPTRLILTDKNGKSCLVCHENIDTPIVYKDSADADMNPFAALKNLKLPDA
ncbi:MAG: DUF177 domain-containing protein [Chitinophagaceae bacterium]|nr:DUF177 domain-containing protein [Oligoflexus sp.]